MNTRLTVAAGLATVLASIALYPLLAGGSWFWGGVGAVIVVGAVGAATRRRAVPAVLCLLAAVGAEFLYLNAVFAGRESWGGLVPTGASLHHLRVLLRQAMAETSKYAPPVPQRPGIVLLTVAGIGLVGVLIDVLAVRLHRPAIAGLPLLVLFCVPLTTDARPGAVGGTLVFCAGMVGYLGLLSADGRHRLRLWGRLIHPWQDDADSQGPDVRPLAAAGRRIGSAAVVLALALPLLIPGLKAHRLFAGGGSAKNGGAGSHGRISLPRPLVLLNSDLREAHPLPVLSYHTTDPTPPYLQVYVLGTLTTNEWKMGPPPATTGLTRRGFLPPVPGIVTTVKAAPGPYVRESIILGTNLSNRGHISYLPLPYAARQVKIHGGSDWRIDGSTLSVLSPSAPLAGLRYSVLAKDVNPLAQQLRDAPPASGSLSAYTFVPAAYRTKQMMKLVSQHTAGRTTPYGKAVALQQWFTTTGGFAYTLKVPQTQSASALIQFLTKTKKGYCQQFAFAMAMLARLVGIPSRVVVGYTQGTFEGNDNWQVKTSDAHAWPELYFPGAGWLRFEPTPSNATGLPGQATALAPPYSLPGADQISSANAQTGQKNQISPNPVATTPADGRSALGKLKKTAPGGAGGAGANRHGGTPPILPVAAALLAVMLVAPALCRAGGRRWRWWRAHDDVTRAHIAWHELRNDLTDYRIGYRASETPRALTRRVATSLGFAGAERDAMARIALAEERASYSVSPADSARLQADEALVRRAVARTCPPSARWLAVVAPPSALIPVRAGARQVLDVFGWMELATTRARRRLTPRSHAPVVPGDKPAPA